MNKNIIYVISAIIVFVILIELNRQNVNTWGENATIEYQEKGKSQEYINSIGLKHVNFNLFHTIKTVTPLILLGLLFTFLSNKIKIALLRFVIVASVVLTVDFLLFGSHDFIRPLNWIFLILALEFIDLKKYLLTILSLIIWLNWYYFINFYTIQHFSETYLTDSIVFSSFMDYVPTILALLLGLSWGKISKYKL